MTSLLILRSFSQIGGFFLFAALALKAQNSPAPLMPVDDVKAGRVPFTFTYGGKASSELLSTWKTAVTTEPSAGGERSIRTYSDPATRLKITVEVRTFKDFPAVEWVLKFKNEGQAGTPVIEDIEPLAAHLPLAANTPAQLRYARGSNGGQDDYEPLEHNLDKGGDFKIGSFGGRSSNGANGGSMPFFNLQVDGSRGIIAAIGWTGNWLADFTRNAGGTALAVTAGMRKTHLVLHPAEEIRSPRILVLNWTGNDPAAAHNAWRRLLLAYYSPQQDGRPVVGPVAFQTWGNQLMADKLALAHHYIDAKIAFTALWTDAGWYGHEQYHPGSTVFNTPWDKNRGSWWPSKECYPDGFKPVSDLLHQNGMKFILWLEPEQADPGSDLIAQHPDWFFKRPDGGGLLNLGNPGARKGITEIVSNVITTAGMDWYRQDFNIEPDPFWTDAPDRVGMAEIQYIEGLYAFWDELLARHPGLHIDNCASGGRRLDLEMISRGVSLWRSDYPCANVDPVGPQLETVGLAPWVPLSSGVCDDNTPYALRSAYSQGLNVDCGCDVIIPKSDEFLKAGLDEYHRAQPYFYGDFHALVPFNRSPDYWTSYQFDRPDLKGGIVLAYRRADSAFASLAPHLQGIDPAATYEVETCLELNKGTTRTMSGKELADLTIAIPAKPGSALVFYRKK